jgi:hypothetical protein
MRGVSLFQGKVKDENAIRRFYRKFQKWVFTFMYNLSINDLWKLVFNFFFKERFGDRLFWDNLQLHPRQEKSKTAVLKTSTER